MPKIIGDSLADHREQVRQRLFAAIRQLIVDRGYDSITLADVAAGAGVGRTAVYNHFPDKESVLVSWAEEETNRYLTGLDEALDQEPDPIARLRIFLRMQMTELAGHHARLAGVGTALSAEGQRHIRAHVAPIVSRLRGIISDAVEAGLLPRQNLDLVVPMISSITAGRFTVGLSGEELERTITSATAFVLHGVGVDSDTH